jgi:hypothetical protein
VPAVDRERDLRAADDGLRADRRLHQIVTIQRDVEGPGRHVDPRDVLQAGRQPPRDRDASRPHADQRQVACAAVALDDLVRNARQ